METQINNKITNEKINLDFKDSKYATGRRKKSIAKVWLKRGSGNIHVNDHITKPGGFQAFCMQPLYFPRTQFHRNESRYPSLKNEYIFLMLNTREECYIHKCIFEILR